MWIYFLKCKCIKSKYIQRNLSISNENVVFEGQAPSAPTPLKDHFIFWASQWGYWNLLWCGIQPGGSLGPILHALFPSKSVFPRVFQSKSSAHQYHSQNLLPGNPICCDEFILKQYKKHLGPLRPQTSGVLNLYLFSLVHQQPCECSLCGWPLTEGCE